LLLTQKQETFCINYFESGNATEAALIAGYSPKTASVIASENLTKPNVVARLQELRDAASSVKIMDVTERKERLSEIARGRLSDFMECGADGAWVNIGLDGCQSASLQELASKTEYDDDGAHPTVVTRIKLHNPIQAIAELNKMERIYGSDVGVTVNNQVNNIIVASEQDKRNVERVMSGERT